MCLEPLELRTNEVAAHIESDDSGGDACRQDMDGAMSQGYGPGPPEKDFRLLWPPTTVTNRDETQTDGAQQDHRADSGSRDEATGAAARDDLEYRLDKAWL